MEERGVNCVAHGAIAQWLPVDHQPGLAQCVIGVLRCPLRFAEVNGMSTVLTRWYMHFPVKKREVSYPNLRDAPLSPGIYIYIPKGISVMFDPELYARSSPSRRASAPPLYGRRQNMLETAAGVSPLKSTLQASFSIDRRFFFFFSFFCFFYPAFFPCFFFFFFFFFFSFFSFFVFLFFFFLLFFSALFLGLFCPSVLMRRNNPLRLILARDIANSRLEETLCYLFPLAY